MSSSPPRLVISALGGDGGKTLVSLGLISTLKNQGFTVAPFKKGPDYIDAAWLSLAAERPTTNLDAYLMGKDVVRQGFARRAVDADFAVIEGNRGLYDGMDAQGENSTAAMARLLTSPVVLILNATKVTRTLAAIVLGCQKLEPETPLSAVILNQVATARHEKVARKAIESATGIPVVGAIPRKKGGGPLPDRHLGLVTPEEHDHALEAIETARQMVSQSVNIDQLIEISKTFPSVDFSFQENKESSSQIVKIGVVRDSAFSFYYPENLEALEKSGAELKWISSFDHQAIPSDICGLYIGGGFPETHAHQISENRTLLESLKVYADKGMPIYAECGGLMLLCQSLAWKGESYPMAGVFPVRVDVTRKPQGHGYCVIRVDQKNPFFSVGDVFRGHEFHYSNLQKPVNAATVYSLERGTGCFDKRDGLIYKNVLASYAHLHALGVPQWSQGFVRQAEMYRQRNEELTAQ